MAQPPTNFILTTEETKDFERAEEQIDKYNKTERDGPVVVYTATKGATALDKELGPIGYRVVKELAAKYRESGWHADVTVSSDRIDLRLHDPR